MTAFFLSSLPYQFKTPVWKDPIADGNKQFTKDVPFCQNGGIIWRYALISLSGKQITARLLASLTLAFFHVFLF